MAKDSSIESNNVTVLPNKPAIMQEAGAWVVRMDARPLTEAELNELHQWMQQSKFHRDYLLKLAANWDCMGVLEELAELFPLPDREPQHTRPSYWQRLAHGWFPRPLSGAGILASLCIFTLFLWAVNGRGTEDYVTAIGERASYTLDDGTVVSLNTNTHLTVQYTESQRVITLKHGEANFDVAKNPERPFLVYAGSGLVWAVGTAFNVRYEGEAVDILVTEGRVKVFSDVRPDTRERRLTSEALALHTEKSDGPTSVNFVSEDEDAAERQVKESAIKPQEALIGAGQALRYSQAIEALESVDIDQFERQLAWQKGALIFKGQRLQEVLNEIGRYTDKQLIVTDPDLQELRVGGHFKTDDVDFLLNSVANMLGIHAEFSQNNRVIFSSGDTSIQ